MPSARRVLAVVVGFAVLCACGEIANLQEPEGDTARPASARDAGPPVQVGAVEVSPSSLDFGDVPCGKESASPLALRFENSGAKSARYEAKLPDGTAFSFRGASSGTVDPGAVALVSLSAVPPGAASASTTLVVTVDGQVLSVPLSVRGVGGALEITPTTLDLGDVRTSGTAKVSAPLVLANTGNRGVTLSSLKVSNTADFSVSLPGGGAPTPTTIAPGATLALTATLTGAGAPSSALTSALTVNATSTCAQVPIITLKGRRISDDVTVSPGAVDFGDVMCGQGDAPPETVTLMNYRASTVTYTAKLAPSSAFSIVSGGTGALPPGLDSAPSVASFTVVARGIATPGNAVSESLTISFDQQSMPPLGDKVVTLTMRPAGAVITATPTDLDFGLWQQNFKMTNTGNAQTTLKYETTADSDAAFRGTKGNVTVDGNKTAELPVSFAWFSPAGDYNATLVVTRASGAAVCNQLPTLTVHTTVKAH